MKSSLEVGSILHQPLFLLLCRINVSNRLVPNVDYSWEHGIRLLYRAIIVVQKKRGYHCFDTPSSMCMYTIKVVFAYFLASSMTPSMYRRVISGSPLVRTVMVFLKCPGNLPLPLYVTFISPFFPG